MMIAFHDSRRRRRLPVRRAGVVRALAACLAAVPAVALGGCASVAGDAGFSEVRGAVRQQGGGADVQWAHGEQGAEAAARVRALLAADLTADAAVAVALAENADLQATFEELGIGQADLLEAALLRNPVLGAEVRFPAAPAIPFEITLAQPVLDLIARPRRRRIAAARFAATQLRVADAVLALEAATRSSFYRVQAAEQTANLARTLAAAADTSAGLAARQLAAGDSADLDLANQQAMAEQARLELNRALGELAAARERLQREMGLGDAAAAWRVAPALPPLAAAEAPLDGLEGAAAVGRLDLAALRSEADAAAQALPLGSLAAIETAEVGGHTERDAADGRTTTGPAVAVSVPLFNWGQAAKRRAAARYRQARDRYAARLAAVRSEVREAWERLMTARRQAELWRDEMVPLRRRILDLTQTRYNAQLVGVFQLLAAKQDAVRAEGQAIDAVRDYWLARTDLERALAGRLPPAPVSTSPPAPVSIAPPAPVSIAPPAARPERRAGEGAPPQIAAPGGGDS
jgi:cobalt-zinc-cadmium efflux system outer membrane protein